MLSLLILIFIFELVDCLVDFREILVIVHYNFPAPPTQVKIHFDIWHGVFPNMIVYGNWNSSSIADIRNLGIQAFLNDKDDEGILAHKTMLHAVLTHFDKHLIGYIYMHDDLIISPRQLRTFDTNSIWIGGPIDECLIEPWDNPNHDWPWFNDPRYGAKKLDALLKENPRILNDILRCGRNNSHVWYKGSADFYYFPSSLLQSFIINMHAYSFHEVFLEIAIPTWAKCSSHHNHNSTLANIQFLNVCTSWDFRYRNRPEIIYNNCKATEGIIHPVKLNRPDTIAMTKEYVDFHL